VRNPFTRSTVAVTDAQQLVAGGEAILIDVRTRKEWKEGHPPEAIHISLASLDGQMARIPGDRMVLVICRSGTRSAQAVRLMRAAGRDAHNVRGGVVGWVRAGLPVSTR